MSDAKPEIWFYHLERSTLDQVLPGLLEKTLQRGWRALIQSNQSHRLDDIDDLLWTYRADSFLPHALASEEHPERQPILLSESAGNPNGAQALFIVDDTELGDTQGFERCFIIFDGRNETSVQRARERWRALKATEANMAYWKQSPEGRWEKAA